jgi:hypothetical protein
VCGAGMKAKGLAIWAVLAMPSAVYADEHRWIKFAAMTACPTMKAAFPCPTLATGAHFTIISRNSDQFGQRFYHIRFPAGGVGAGRYEAGEGYVAEDTVDQISTTEDPKITAERERRVAAAAAEKARKQQAEARAECERRGPPKIGMTPTQAIESCWRTPKRIIKKTTVAGTTEDYIYSIGHIFLK